MPDATGTVALTSQLPSTALDDITAGDAAVSLETTTGNITIDAQGSDTDIIFKGTDNTTDITALTLDMSESGDASFNANIGVGTTPKSDYDDSMWNAIDLSNKGGLIAYDGQANASFGTTGETLIVTNAYHNGTNWKAKETGESSGYSAKQDGTHTFYGTKGTSANADDQQTFVFNNLQGDFTTCYSYYLLSEEGFKKSGSANDETIAGLNKSADLSLESVFMIGQQLGMNTDTMRNRVKTSFESMKKEMGEDFKNFSSV
mgnify:CR=1 FL=1